jgi:Protein kinase domain/PA14 domain
MPGRMKFDWMREFIAGVGREAIQKIGRYEIGKLLGEGGSAVVYEAYDPSLDRLVALKVLRDQGGALGKGASDEAILRLKREAQAVARLRHPNIVAIHEVGPNYISMELVSGQTFAELGPGMSIAERVLVLTTVAQTVAFAHVHGVIHRDLKPTNILVEDGGRIVLTDFGIARVMDSDALTRHDRVMGTPQYMAPEQVRGETSGPAADIWALGVLLYEALTGKRPFEGENDLQIFHKIDHETPRVPPGPLGLIVAHALCRRPQDRYPSAESFAADLQRWSHGDRLHFGLRWRRPVAALGLLAGVVALTAGAVRFLATDGTANLTPGLGAEYFPNMLLQGEAVERTDPQVNFIWLDEVSPVPGIPDADFSVRWTGKLRAEHSGKTRLCVRSDDGFRLWLDAKLVLDEWDQHSAHILCGLFDLQRDQLYDLKIEYYQESVDGIIEMWWESPLHSAPRIIPAENLFSAKGHR